MLFSQTCVPFNPLGSTAHADSAASLLVLPGTRPEDTMRAIVSNLRVQFQGFSQTPRLPPLPDIRQRPRSAPVESLKKTQTESQCPEGQPPKRPTLSPRSKANDHLRGRAEEHSAKNAGRLTLQAGASGQPRKTFPYSRGCCAPSGSAADSCVVSRAAS